MVTILAFIVPAAILGVIAIIFALGARGRGKPIQCPECGEIFKRPALSEKKSGLGFTFGSLGDYTCPKCGYRASTSSFGPPDKDGSPK
jgi:predicted RNA-binding Zn-ribbon protein involved in translation (DUF1610 family)